MNKTISEQELNTMLSPFGLQAKGGAFVAADGFEISTSNVAAATSFNGAPALPDVGGSGGMNSNDAANGIFAFDEAAMETSSLMWMALSTMAETGIRDMDDAKEIKSLMQTSKNEMAKAKMKSKESEIVQMQKDAEKQFTYAVAAVVVSFCIGALGSSISAGAAKGSTAATMGAGMSAAASGVGAAVSAYGKMESMNGGPAEKMHEEQLKQMHYEMMESMADGAIQDAQANYESAKEGFKLALKIMSEHVERATQISGTITRS